jgi:hypothetical protein
MLALGVLYKVAALDALTTDAQRSSTDRNDSHETRRVKSIFLDLGTNLSRVNQLPNHTLMGTRLIRTESIFQPIHHDSIRANMNSQCTTLPCA